MGLSKALESHEIGPVGQAGAETDENDKLPCPELPFSKGLVKSEWNRRCELFPYLSIVTIILFLTVPSGRSSLDSRCSAALLMILSLA